MSTGYLTLDPEPVLDADAYAASYTPDCAEGLVKTVTLTGNITVNAPLNAPSGGKVLWLVFTQDATGGRSVTWNAAFNMSANEQANRAANAITIFRFANVGTSASPVWRKIGSQASKLLVGETGFGDVFDFVGLSHADVAAVATDYGLLLSSAGTILNAKTSVQLALGGTVFGTLDAGAFTMTKVIQTNNLLTFRDVGLAQGGMAKRLVSNAAFGAGDIVCADASGNGRVGPTVTPSDPLVVGVSLGAPGAAAVNVDIAISGFQQVNVDVGAVAVGDLLVTSATSGKAKTAPATGSPAGTVFAKAVTAKAGGASGQVWALILPGLAAGLPNNDLLPWKQFIHYQDTPDLNTGPWVTVTGNVSASIGYENGGYIIGAGLQNDEVGWDVVLAAGTWELKMTHHKYFNIGIYSVYVGGVLIGTLDGYSAGATYNNSTTFTGIAIAAAGKKRVSLKMAAKNASASSYYGWLSAIHLRRTA